jgi:hypothetical protein
MPPSIISIYLLSIYFPYISPEPLDHYISFPPGQQSGCTENDPVTNPCRSAAGEVLAVELRWSGQVEGKGALFFFACASSFVTRRFWFPCHADLFTCALIRDCRLFLIALMYSQQGTHWKVRLFNVRYSGFVANVCSSENNLSSPKLTIYSCAHAWYRACVKLTPSYTQVATGLTDDR